MRKLSIVAVVFGLFAAGAVCVEQAPGEASAEKPALALHGPAVARAHLKQARAVRDAAKATYQSTQLDYDRGMAVFSEVYAWSRRWLEAELNLAADRPAEIAVLQEHWKRMKRCYFAIKALNATGSRGGERQKLDAADFYVAEAELWLAAAGGEVPQKLAD